MDGLMKKDNANILEQAKKHFEKAMIAEKDNRELAKDDIKFARLSEQWPEQIKHQRELQQRPCLTINKLPSFIRKVVNEGRKNKPAITISPVDSNADPETAEVLQGIIRNIEATSFAEAAYDTALDCAVTSGLGYIRVDYDYPHDGTFDLDINILRVSNPFTVYGDPNSTEVDSRDWNSAFVTEMMEKSAFEDKYPEAETVDFETDSVDAKDKEWFSEDEVRVAEYWVREEVTKEIFKLSDGQVMGEDVYELNQEMFETEGIEVVDSRPAVTHKVMQYVMTGMEILEENEWKGKYIPIIPVYGEEIDNEGKRVLKSLIRDVKDAQRNFNYWRTNATESVALAPKAPFIGPVGAFSTDEEKWATANTENHPYLEYDDVDGAPPPQRQPFAGVPAGSLQEAMNSADDMKSVMGLYDAAMGAQSNETSGIAINARKVEGDVSTFHFVDNLARAIRHTGLIIVDLIPHIFTEPRIARILGEDRKPESVPVNQEIEQKDENGQPIMDEETGEPAMRIYDLTTGKYDVTVKAGPSYDSKREEASTQMFELLQAFPQAAPYIGDLLVSNLDWPGADEIAKRLKALLPSGDGEEDPKIKELTEIIEQGKAYIQKLEEEQGIKVAELDIKREETEIRKYDAQTDRMKVEAEISAKAVEAARTQAQPAYPPQI